ncbi:Uncharacterized protein Adt_47560 [Abeliophyllum distichum]|uniref:Uncharacterized protein n=1 Tax=Abeliophyllum distichum TaxID=126358 RepID=A0ABD1NTJ6_9LAMI
MKFSTTSGVAKIYSNQTKASSCYMNVLRKVAKREETSPIVMMIQTESMDVDPEQADKDMMLDEGLDPQIIGPDSVASPAEKLEAFPVNHSDPSQMLQVGQKLEEGMKEELKQFL